MPSLLASHRRPCTDCGHIALPVVLIGVPSMVVACRPLLGLPPQAVTIFCVPTVLFQTLHVFFVIRLANREILFVEVTPHPTAGWVAQQIVECCAWDRAPPRFLIHDRDSRYGASFDRRVRGLGIRQVRTPFRSPRAMPSLRDG
jgi:hypothetical protein